jgi:hypothetical protein
MSVSSALPESPSSSRLSAPAVPTTQAGSVAGGLSALFADAETRKERDPDAALLDLQLIPALKDMLKPTLEKLGFTFTEGKAEVKYDDRAHTYTNVVKDGEVRRTLHIPNWILDNPNTANYNALSALAYAFEKETLVIFSEKLDVPPFKIERLLTEQWFKHFTITVHFVPWRHVVDLGSMEENPRIQSITRLLRLDELAQPKDTKVLTLGAEQKSKLVEALTAAFAVASDLMNLSIKLQEPVPDGDDLSEKMIKFVTRMESHGKLEDLILKACEVNSGNKLLADVKKDLLG